MRPVQTLVTLGSLLGLAVGSPCKPRTTASSDTPSSAVSISSIISQKQRIGLPIDRLDLSLSAGLHNSDKSADTTTSVTISTTLIDAATTSATTSTKEIDTTTTSVAFSSTTTLEGTTTSVITSTSDLSVPTPFAISPNCQAAGFNVHYYRNAFQDEYGNDQMSVPPSYYITEDLKPLGASLTSETYFPQDYMKDVEGFPVIYPNPRHPGTAYYVGYTRTLSGGIKVDANNFTLVYTGYYKAPETGPYELCIAADNANTLYFGEGNAFSCGTGEPSVDAPALVLTATGYHFNNPVRCGSVNLVQGHYYPVRNVMGNKNAVSMFDFTIKTPSGTAGHNFAGRAYPLVCRIDHEGRAGRGQGADAALRILKIRYNCLT